MKDKYLPIGTVVKVKGSKQYVMITSYLIFATGDSNDKKMFDYGACIFPTGIIDSQQTLGFNHNDVEEVIHMGFENEEQKKLNELLNKQTDDLKKIFETAIKNG